MSKYAPLERHLRQLDRLSSHVLTFGDIEQLLDAPLPKSARQYQAWWANQRGPGHVQTHGWLEAGFHTADLDLKRQRITFVPVALPREPRGAGRGSSPVGLTIEQAKRAVARHYGVGVEAVQIIVRS